MRKTPRSAITLVLALVVTAASAGPVGGYGVEKSVNVTTSISTTK